MKKVLVVEDDADVFALLQYNLEKDGFSFAGIRTGRGATDLCLRERPDLVLLDVMLPDMNGMEICKSLRQMPEMAQTPILFLTARSSEEDRVVGLELGASDYIVKPFFVRELLARVRSNLRPRKGNPRLLRRGPLELDSQACRVRLDGVEVVLTATEFRLLEFLLSSPGIVFTREQLLDAVWGHGHAVTDRTVDVYVLRLRQKLEERYRFIRSVRGFGYSFEPEVTRIALVPPAAQAMSAP